MVLRIVLGTVYTAMGVAQLASFGDMPRILSAYGLVTDSAATALAVALIAGELVCGIWLLARPRSKALAPVWVYTAVSVVWTVWPCRRTCGAWRWPTAAASGST